MTKYEALSQFLGKYGKIKDFYCMVKGELKDFVCAWKNDVFAPDPSVLDGLSDSDFMDKYKELFKDTAQHEAAEAVLYIKELIDYHGFDILKYVELVDKYKALKEGRSVEKKVNVFIPTK
jgi:hypothetical protein